MRSSTRGASRTRRRRCSRPRGAGRTMAPDAPAAPAAPDGAPPGDAALTLLLIAAATGLVVSLAAWLFLEATHQTQVGVYDKLPQQLGDHSAPLVWAPPLRAR